MKDIDVFPLAILSIFLGGAIWVVWEAIKRS